MWWNNKFVYIWIGILLIGVGKLSAQDNLQYAPHDSIYVKQLIADGYKLEKLDLQIAKMREALQLSQQIGFQNGAVASLSALIQLHQSKKEHIEALRYCFILIPILEKINTSSAIPYYIICANLLVEEKVPEKAISYYEKAYQLNKDLNVLSQIINTAIGSHNFTTALTYCKLRKDQVTLPIDKVNNLLQMAYCEQQLKQNIDAGNSYKEAFELATANSLIAEAALATNNLGYQYFYEGKFNEAIGAFEECLKYDLSAAQERNVLINLSIAYQNIGNPQKCMSTLEKVQRLCTTDADKANIHRLIAACYLNQGNTYSATIFNEMARKESKLSGNYRIIADVYLNQSLIDQKLYDYEGAFQNYRMYLYINDSLLNAELLQKSFASNYKESIEKNEKELRELALNDQIKYLTIQQLQLEKDMLQLEAQNKNKEISKLKLEQENKQQQLTIIESEAARARQALAAKVLDQKLNDLKQEEEKHRIELQKAQAEEKSRLQEISLLEQESEITKLQLDRQSEFKRNTYRYAFLGGLLFLAIAIGLFFVRRKNIILGKQNTKIENQVTEIQLQRNIIEEERLKSEQLLLNILPASVATELKERGEATPQQYEMVSVLFTDFVNFTSYAEQVSHGELVNELNTIFQAFDEIIARNNMEKIKTIGDSYMCAGGLPMANLTNAHDAVQAALDMVKFTKSYNQNVDSKLKLEMRIGINTGRVVAGVIGKSKFAYDIWGDDVNIAARMEQSGERGRINISGTTYNYVKDDFECTFRGMVDAKNKGKIEMYFVEGKKSPSTNSSFHASSHS